MTKVPASPSLSGFLLCCCSRDLRSWYSSLMSMGVLLGVAPLWRIGLTNARTADTLPPLSGSIGLAQHDVFERVGHMEGQQPVCGHLFQGGHERLRSEALGHQL